MEPAWVLEVEMEPQPLRRHRARVQRRRDGRTWAQIYDDERNQPARDQLLWAFRALRRPCFPAGEPVELSVVALFARPDDHWEDGSLRPGVPIYYTDGPDHDNVLKLVCDALNEWAWADDVQIAKSTTQKVYSDRPGKSYVSIAAALLPR